MGPNLYPNHSGQGERVSVQALWWEWHPAVTHILYILWDWCTTAGVTKPLGETMALCVHCTDSQAT